MGRLHNITARYNPQRRYNPSSNQAVADITHALNVLTRYQALVQSSTQRRTSATAPRRERARARE